MPRFASQALAALRLLSVLILITTPGIAADPRSLHDYEASINRTCHSDADCTVKDVHNCCGYYPSCVNRNTKTDPALVRRLCEAEQMTGVCGFSEISACRCINNACADADSSGSQANPVKQ